MKEPIAWTETSATYGGTSSADESLRFIIGFVDPRYWWWSAKDEQTDNQLRGWANGELAAKQSCADAVQQLLEKRWRRRTT